MCGAWKAEGRGGYFRVLPYFKDRDLDDGVDDDFIIPELPPVN